jgi:PPOX class probable FMN-dependent enzyme
MTATTTAYAFRDVVTTEAELREIIGSPSEMALKKQLPALDAHCKAFIARSPFALVATANARGDCDVSPRGDAPGFALVLDDRTLLIPDRPGNKRVDGFLNVLENPHAGLIFIVPNVEETLRVNGRACLVRDADLLERMAAQGKTPTPTLALAVEVEEAYLHCAKAFRRSRLWQTATWPDRSELPSLGTMLLDQTRPANTTAEALDAGLEEAYAKRLY